jgi:copper(I)-binding protein
MRVLALLLLCLAAASSAAAKDITHENITVRQSWARATIGNLRMTAGYFSAENTAAFTDRLIGAESPAAERVELHLVKDGAMMMAEAVEIGPGSAITFAPGGYHLMIGPLTAALAEGETLPITLRFERAGEVTVDFEVEAANATAPD